MVVYFFKVGCQHVLLFSAFQHGRLFFFLKIPQCSFIRYCFLWSFIRYLRVCCFKLPLLEALYLPLSTCLVTPFMYWFNMLFHFEFDRSTVITLWALTYRVFNNEMRVTKGLYHYQILTKSLKTKHQDLHKMWTFIKM